MGETPRMVIVPAMPKRKMRRALEEFSNPESAWYHAVRLSPGAGRIRRADLERAMSAADHAYASSPGPAPELNRIWQNTFAAALGLEIAEEGDDALLPQTGEGEGADHANVEPAPAEEVARIGLVPRSEVERLQDALERERSQVATGIGAVKEAIRKREWLRLGRGSFEWDDERWKDEFGHAIDEILQAMESLRSIACDWSDCPTDRERIKRARDGTPAPMSEGERALADIAAERRRQVEVEGFTTDHDDEHISGELARAGALYAEYASSNMMHDAGMKIAREGRAVVGWPWEAEWFKPKDRYTDLRRAGALIAAEMGRLLRLARRQGTTEGIGPEPLLDAPSKREDES